jgi:DNA-binding PadR family transcriptional regulator
LGAVETHDSGRELQSAMPVTVHLKSISGPRGLLRSYILYRLSKNPLSGYDLISELDEATGGTWHPGSGSIYPILEDLRRKKLIEVVSKGHRSKQVYSLTQRGKEALDEERRILNQFASKWNRIRLALMGLMSADNLTTLILETTKANRTAWKKVLESKEMPKSEAVFNLKEYRLLLDNELHWASDQLKTLG